MKYLFPTYSQALLQTGVFIFFLIILCSPSFTQSEAAYHINSIRHAPFKAITDEGLTGDSVFVEFVIQNILEAPRDTVFISNRDLLTSLCVKDCGTDEVHIADTMKDGTPVDIILKTRPFVADSHQISYFEEPDSTIEMIDSLPAFGGVYRLPTVEIDTLIVRIDSQEVIVPREAYINLYEPDLCMEEMLRQSVMAFPSESGEYLYIYLTGGEGGNTYFAKLIFDRERYLKKIVTEYGDLLRFGAFRWGFIGY